MKTNIIIYLFALLAGVLITVGCNDYDEDTAKLDDRITELEKTAASLSDVCVSINSLISQLQGQITKLVAKDKELENKLEALAERVRIIGEAGYLPKETAAATYATIEEVKALKNLLGDISGVIEPGTEEATLIGYIQGQLKEVEKECMLQVAALLRNRIQSLTYVPGSSEGKAVVSNSRVPDLNLSLWNDCGSLKLQYEVRGVDGKVSAALADTLALYGTSLLALELRSVQTRAGEEYPALELAAVTADSNILTIEASAEVLGDRFFSGDDAYSVALALNDAEKTGNYLKSDYVHLTPAVKVLQGRGTEENPFILMTPEHLQHLNLDFAGNYKNTPLRSCCFAFGADIDMSKVSGWGGLGYKKDLAYTGIFDGRGHVLTVKSEGLSASAAAGLLVSGNGCTLKGITVKGEITSNNTRLAGIIVTAGTTEAVTVEDCHFEGALLGTQCIGGVISECGAVTLKSCTVKGTLTGTLDKVGGIIAHKQMGGDCVIEDCRFEGDVTFPSLGGSGDKGQYVGGMLALKNDDAGNVRITNCRTSFGGASAIYQRGGGMVGSFNGGNLTLEGCVNESKIEIERWYAGGMVGYFDGGGDLSFNGCENQGEVVVERNYIGGMVGFVNAVSTLTVENCKNTGKISVPYGVSAGGMVGRANVNTAMVLKGSLNAAEVYGDANEMGGMVGYLKGTGTLWAENCRNEGTITSLESNHSNSYVGGIVGRLLLSGSSTVKDCENAGRLIAEGSYMGGIVADAGNTNGSLVLKNCKNTVALSGYSWVGGILGYFQGSGDLSFEDCRNTGKLVSEYAYAGGMASYCQKAGNLTLTRCESAADVTALGSAAGMIGEVSQAGQLTVTACLSSGKADNKGKDYSGGLFGRMITINSMKIENCRSTMQLVGAGNIGGLLASFYRGEGTIDNCVFSGSITASGMAAGGIVGAAGPSSTSDATEMNLTIINCGNTGAVTGNTQVGGITGLLYRSNLKIYNCYNQGALTMLTTSAKNSEGVGGILGALRTVNTKGTLGEIRNCYNVGRMTYNSNCYAGGVIGACYGISEYRINVGIVYVLNDAPGDSGNGVWGVSTGNLYMNDSWTKQSDADMQDTGFVTALNAGKPSGSRNWKAGNPYPVIAE